jgi:hypothetical protein
MALTTQAMLVRTYKDGRRNVIDVTCACGKEHTGLWRVKWTAPIRCECGIYLKPPAKDARPLEESS